MSSNYKFSTTDLLHAIREIPKTLISRAEKYILMVLLSCMNTNNETWYGMESIAEYACMGLSTALRSLRTLEKKKFITVERPAIYTHHQTNKYHLNLEYILSFYPVDKYQNVDKSHVKMTTDNEVACQNDTPSHVKMTIGRMSKRPSKIDIKKDIKMERGARTKKRSLLTVNFQPSKATIEVGKKLGFTADEAENEFTDFYDYNHGEYATDKEWDLKFRRWLMQGAKIRAEQAEKNKPSPTEKPDPYKEEEMKMKRFGQPVGVSKYLK